MPHAPAANTANAACFTAGRVEHRLSAVLKDEFWWNALTNSFIASFLRSPGKATACSGGSSNRPIPPREQLLFLMAALNLGHRTQVLPQAAAAEVHELAGAAFKVSDPLVL